MASTERIYEVYSYYVNREPSNEEYSIKRFEILRERFGRILKADKFRSVQLAMGSNTRPIQDPIANMNDDEFNEFIADTTSGKRRKEIYNKNSRYN